MERLHQYLLGGHFKSCCPKLNPQTSQLQVSKPSASMKGVPGACHYCNQPGHLRRECPKLHGRTQSGTGSQVTRAPSAVVQSGFRVPQAPQLVVPSVGSYPVRGSTATTFGHQLGHQGSSQQSRA
ncbi:uncharacterized protein LOC132313822 [Cornus florida]|uniref:uncharacterized protein LOC132313822 n=1 Tax=Cornus florida TaxID=4283 RepID=UPI00289EACA7|nr:uncharacterized protein LOC132313822 [Cornus florida]